MEVEKITVWIPENADSYRIAWSGLSDPRERFSAPLALDLMFTCPGVCRADTSAIDNSANGRHFHMIYAGKEAQVCIDPIVILQGDLPRRASSMVIEWAALHQHKLLENWERVRDNKPIEKIEPLE